MQISLNSKQAETLSAFFIDIAKGLILGTVGYSLIIPSETKIIIALTNIIIAGFAIKFSLSLLEKYDDN